MMFFILGFVGASLPFCLFLSWEVSILGLIIICLAYVIMVCIANNDPSSLFGSGLYRCDKNINPVLCNLVEEMSIASGLGRVPDVYIMDAQTPNAFACGLELEKSFVCVTKGLLEILDRDELQGVIAHELAHIGNRDIRLDMMLIAGVGIFGLLADGFSPIRTPQKNGVSIKTGSSSSKNKDSGFLLLLAVFITLMIFHHIIEPLLLLAVSRTREFAADATGAMITHHPQALADALKKISKDSTVEILENHKNMAQACIYAPFNAKPLFSLFSTHPSVEERIKRLEQMAGNAII